MRFDTGGANDAGNDHHHCSASIPPTQSKATEAACEHSSPFVLRCRAVIHSTARSFTVLVL